MNWKPLLDGELAERARQSVRAIADALEADTTELGPTYSAGFAGIALLHGYLAVADSDEHSAEVAETRLSQAIDALTDGLPAGFFSGFSGVAWTSQHVYELLTGEATAEMTQEVDEILAQAVRLRPWKWHYDLIYGLVGIGCYALDHAERKVATDLLEQIVAQLEDLAEPRDGGLTWWTSPDLIKLPSIREQHPDGYYDMGLAHGVPGVVGMLGRTYAAGIAVEKAKRLVEGAVAWLLADKRADGGGSLFGVFAPPPDQARCRSAWCYGDPGVAVALLSAARSLGNPEWEREAVSLALRDCARPLAETGVVDPMLCHGTSGLGHLYNRLYQATGEATFAQAATGWFERTLEMRRQGEGIGGYSNWWPEIGEWRTEAGFLSGAAGVGLALLGAISSVEPNWDRPMLLAIPA